MIVTCPECDTRYLAETSGFLPNGRTVRCANCSNTWFQEPPSDTAEILAIESIEDVETQMVSPGAAALPAPYVKQPTKLKGLASVLVVLAIIGSAFSGALVLRQDVVRLWPPAQGLYNLVGLQVAPLGLTFQDTNFQRRVENGQAVLIVFGEIVNDTDTPLRLLPVRITLRDASEQPLDQWQFSLGEEVMQPKERRKFETRRVNPPSNAHDLKVEFVQVAS